LSINPALSLMVLSPSRVLNVKIIAFTQHS